MTNKSYIAAFDLDRTILSVNSSKLVVQASRKSGLMPRKDFLHAILFSIIYKLRIGDPNKLVVAMAMWLKGLDEKEVQSLINEHIIPQLADLVRPVIKQELDYHREKGASLVLLSSALNYICEPVAAILNMHDVVSSRMEVRNGLFTGHPSGKLVFGREKLERMRRYCHDKGFKTEEAWYYGDAFTDRFILEKVGYAVCVDPENRLKRLAGRNHWKILQG